MPVSTELMQVLNNTTKELRGRPSFEMNLPSVLLYEAEQSKDTDAKVSLLLFLL